mgnify:CR=1 FL=1
MVHAIKHSEKKNNIYFILFLILTIIGFEKSSFSNNDLLQEGKILSHIAGCYGCHTSKNNAEFSGGYEIKTKYGIFITPNITKNTNYGIGKWDKTKTDGKLEPDGSVARKQYFARQPDHPWFRMIEFHAQSPMH